MSAYCGCNEIAEKEGQLKFDVLKPEQVILNRTGSFSAADIDNIDYISAGDKAYIKEITDFWFTDPSEPLWDRHDKPGPWKKKWASNN